MKKMTIDRLADAVTKLHDTAMMLSKAQESVDALQKSLLSIRGGLEVLTDILEDEFYDKVMRGQVL